MAFDFLDLLGRALVASLFLVSALGHTASRRQALAEAASVGVPMPRNTVPAWTAIELICGLMILLGIGAWLGAAILAAFTFYIIIKFFPFWAVEQEEVLTTIKEFINRLAVVGGLILS